MIFSLKSILFVKWHNGSIVALKYFEIFWISFICFVLPNLIQLWNLWWWIQWKTIISHPKNSASFFLLALCEYACYLSICVHIWVTWDKFSRQGNCLFGLGGAAQTPVNTSANTSQQCALNTRTPTHVLLLRTLNEGISWYGHGLRFWLTLLLMTSIMVIFIPLNQDNENIWMVMKRMKIQMKIQRKLLFQTDLWWLLHFH